MIEKKNLQMKNAINSYIQFVNTMLRDTIKGVTSNDWALVRNVIDILEPEANLFELEIAQDCLGILALFHPEASDLRSIVKMSAMGGDLERIADLVTKIALASYHWKDLFNLNDYPKILEMVTENHTMLQEISKAFIDENCLIAVTVIQHDDRVDDLCTQVIRHLIKEMNRAEDVEYLLQIMNITKNLERIADLITHLAEDVIFIKEGLVPNKDKKSHE